MADPATFAAELGLLLTARFPLLAIETWEEDRAVSALRDVAADPARVRTPRRTLVWSETRGLYEPGSGAVLAGSAGSAGSAAGAASAQPVTAADRETRPWERPPGETRGTGPGDSRDPHRLLDRVVATTQPTVYVLLDLHGRLGAGGRADGALVRRLRDVVAHLRASTVPVTLVLLSPVLQIPVELEKTITVVDFRLPDETDLRALLDDLLRSNARVEVRADEVQLAQVVRAATGLTEVEAENAFALAVARDGALTGSAVEVVLAEKRQTIRKSGVLELVPPRSGPQDVAGLERLRGWLTARSGSWLAEAEGFPLPAPKGVLVTGVPGCGKSLTAAATAALWGLPLLRLDLGRVFAGLVGSSESNMRRALQTAESIAPCVLWLDEVEKGFGGATAGAGDSGTSQRVFATFLTWLQEKSAPVFVFATANDLEHLPAEFLRKGRFDEIFFVDLPTRRERRDVWRVHLERRLTGRFGGLGVDDELLTVLAGASDGLSGAEVEQAVVTALYAAYADRRPVSRADLLEAVAATVPISVTQAEQVRTMREWASQRAVAATAPADLDDAVDLDDTAPAPDGLPPDPWPGGVPPGWDAR